MIGLGLGGGAEQALTVVGLLGADAMERDLGRIAGAFNSVDEAQSRASRSGAAMQRVGMGLTAGLSGSMIALGLTSIKSANDAVESESLVATTFGDTAAKIKMWSEQRRKALGVNSYDERRQAASFQNLFTAGGLDPQKAAKMSQAFTEMKDDLVSFYNVADPDTFAALQSGINGEAEPMRRFGIYLSDAAVQAYAYKSGIASAGTALTDFQKQQARAGFILDAFNKSKAKGDLERTKDSPTNQIRRLQNERTQAMAELGMSLIPLELDALKLLNKGLPVVKSLVREFTNLSETTRKWVVGIGLGIGPLTWITGKVITMAAAWKSLKGGGVESAVEKALGKSVGTMTVNAGVVNINGKGVGGSPGGGAPSAPGVPLGTTPKVPWYARPVGPQFSTGAGPLGLRGATTGSALAGVVIGAAAGYGVRDDVKHLGYSEGQSDTAAAAAGLSAAALTAFNPAAGVILAAGVALRYGVDHFYNKPMERKAELGTGVENTDMYGKDMASQLKKAQDEIAKGGDRRKLAEVYTEMSAKARLAGDSESADVFNATARSQRNIAKKEDLYGTPEFWEKQRKRSTDLLKGKPVAIAGGEFKVDNDTAENRRRIYERWAKAYEREFAKDADPRKRVTAAALLRQYDRDNAPASAERAPRGDLDPRALQLAAMFGVDTGGEGGGVAIKGQRNRDDSITIQASRADKDARDLRTLNRTPPRRPT